MKKLLLALMLMLPSAALAADNGIQFTPGAGGVARSKDVGAGVQLPGVFLSDQTGAFPGAFTNYGTNPGAVLVPGMNAFITNVPAVSQNGVWNIATVTAVTAITNALPAGSNIIGNVRVDQTTPGTTNGVALIDGADATQGAKADSVCATATANACSEIAMLKFIANSVSGPVPTQANTVSIGAVGVQANTTGGANQFHLIAANTTNSTNIKASAGTVYAVQLAGLGSTPAFVKFYDTAGAPTCNTDPVKTTLMIPSASTAANGAGSNVSILVGKAFTTGIGICVVAGIADNNNVAVAAATYIINVDWK